MLLQSHIFILHHSLVLVIADWTAFGVLIFALSYDVIFAASEHDTVNEAGNYSIADEYVVTDFGDNARLVTQQQRWDLNYREAAIYLQEGENNDKFSAHPSRQVFLSSLASHILGQFSLSSPFSNCYQLPTGRFLKCFYVIDMFY